MKATVDQNSCIGCGLCANDCPEVFTMNADKAQGKDVPAGKEEAAKAAGMNLKVARELVQKLQDDGHIRPGLVDSERSDGRPIKVWRYWPTSEGSDEPDDGAF